MVPTTFYLDVCKIEIKTLKIDTNGCEDEAADYSDKRQILKLQIKNRFFKS
jgi:hypothetical protein